MSLGAVPDGVSSWLSVGAKMGKSDHLLERIAEGRLAIVARVEQAQKDLREFDAIVKTIMDLRESVSRESFDAFLDNFKHPLIDRFIYEGLSYGAKVLSSPLEVAESARAILIAARRPLKRGELVKEFEKARIELPGKDRNKNLGTIMWRHPKLIVSLPGRGYWAKGVPLKGIYDPDTFVEASSESSGVDSE